MPDQIVELKPRPRDKVSIKLSGGRFFTIPAEAAQTLSVNAVLSDEEIERLAKMDQYFRAKDKAILLLSRRPRTREEIRRALDSLSIEPPIRDGVVAELEESGLINDLRFAREYVRVKSEVKYLGPHRLRYDLKRLGVSRETVDEVLSDSFDLAKQEKMARELVARKTGAGRLDEKTVRRMADFLRRKGYDHQVINRVSYELLNRSRTG